MNTDDKGEATMWVAIVAPLLMIAALAVVIIVWMWTGPLIAILAFAGLCSVGAAGVAAIKRRNRGF